MILTHKQGQGHQTWYELGDPKQGYNNSNTQFEKKTRLNNVCEKANENVFVKPGNTSITSFEYMHKSKTVVCSWP